jgi:hypothetical protein
MSDVPPNAVPFPSAVLELLGSSSLVGHHTNGIIQARAYLTRREVGAFKERLPTAMGVTFEPAPTDAWKQAPTEWWREGELHFDGGVVSVWCVSNFAQVYLDELQATAKRAVEDGSATWRQPR